MANVGAIIPPALNTDSPIHKKYMDRTTKNVLLRLFSELSAHENWTVAVRNKKFRDLLKLPQFSDLNRGQIKRVYDLYDSTINLKKLIASLVVSKTGEMMNDSSQSMSVDSMIGILGTIYYIFSLNEAYSGLPDKLREFLLYCYKADNAFAEGLSFDLDEQYLLYIKTLIVYYNDALLPTYVDFWEALAEVESGEMNITGVNLSVFLSHLEYQMKLQRDLEVGNRASLLRTLFIGKTCMKVFLVEISYDDMYSKVTEENVAKYPAYVELVCRKDLRDDLNHAVFAIFELLCYEYYAAAVTMIKAKKNRIHRHMSYIRDVFFYHTFASHVSKSYISDLIY
jgi:hypothetical protein